MAEAIGLSSGLLALATFASQSRTRLYNTIQSLQSHYTGIRDLKDELEALRKVLDHLSKILEATVDLDLSALELPLLRCGNVCQDFEDQLLKCLSRSGGSRMSFRDWAKLKYMGDEIDGFKQLLAGYRLSIRIVLADANLRKSSITVEFLESYKDLTKTSTEDLQERLERINEKLDIMLKQTVTESTSDVTELGLITEEKLSAQECLQICNQVSEHINQLQLTLKHSASPLAPIEPDAMPERAINANLQECKNGLVLVTERLETRVKDLMDRLATKSKKAMTFEEEVLARLREVLATTRECMDICLDVDKWCNHPDVTGETTVDCQMPARKGEDQLKPLLLMQNDLVSVKSVTDNSRPWAVLGQMSDATLEQLRRSQLKDDEPDPTRLEQINERTLADSESQLRDIEQKLDATYASVYQDKVPIDSGYGGSKESSLLPDDATADPTRQSDTPVSLKDVDDAQEKSANLCLGSAERYERVIPSDEDIGSRKATSKIPEVIIAEKHLETCLLERKEIVEAVGQILHDDNVDNFCQDFRELLKYYYIDLKAEAKTNLQNATAAILRGHWYRERLAKQLAHKLTGHEIYDSDEEDDDRPRASAKSLSDLNEWIANNQGFGDPNAGCQSPLEDVDLGPSNSDDDVSNSDSELTEAVKDLNNIKHMEYFAFQGKAFRKLLERIQIHAIQPQHRDLRRILMTLPDTSIRFDDSLRQSWIDKCKSLIEERSNGHWDWWPLCQVQAVLASQNCRVSWKCHCGRKHYRDIPKTEASKFQRLLELRDMPLSQDHLCFGRQRERRTWRQFFQSSNSTLMSGPLEATTQHNPDAQRPSRGVPVSATAGPSQSNGRQDTMPNISSSGNMSSKLPGDCAPSAESFRNQQLVYAMSIGPANDLRLILGVKGKKRCLNINQIDLKKHVSPTDGDLVSDIVAAYKSTRGWMRLYFSVHQLRFCVFRKFLKYRRNRISSIQDGVPEQDIEYMYKDGSQTPPNERPPISREEFEDSLFPCTTPCMYWFWPWHDCIGPLTQKRLYERIPKKKTLWALDCHGESEAWGLEAGYDISLFHVIIYHVVTVGATFGFWGWWQVRHPDDIEGAGVPLTVILGLLSLFWTVSGILTTSHKLKSE